MSCKEYLTNICLKNGWWKMKNHIKSLRKMKKLSQEELAERCNVSRQTINAIENDKYDPSLVLAFALANILGITVDELFICKEDGE